ncbi:hypothetical protein FB567DRAFT_96175 [Paraphoma chrysanthemicola]|uniref:Zn(2)-C6 fungal-type domain-containing protein n=1 Tax=Paraphoma chrysanthemicola TaxID=798071 RepID=A0A8K0R2N6_9PLEO|nr:hypothetical protein FB567DRAFT_96175 [Paraphoma chrysanthemicola]
MSQRLPACEPCRSSKLSCDHVHPTCTRCKKRNTAGDCLYRARPFKKRKHQAELGDIGEERSSAAIDDTPAAQSTYYQENSRRYSNPGYLGPTSHTTLLDQVSNDHHVHASSTQEIGLGNQSHNLACAVNEAKIKTGGDLISRIQSSPRLHAWISLVESWLGEGINLPVAEPFTSSCAQAALRKLQGSDRDPTSRRAADISTELFVQSCMPITMTFAATVDDFREHFCAPNCVRWETLGIFFAAVSRATIDVTSQKDLYESESERKALQHVAMDHSDACLDIALSLDCLNDLQLVLQYENFILHSLVDGDQSYHSWRKLGDVVSSLFALGYHEQLGDITSTPPFLRELRHVVFSRAYSADKNCSIFLGRPPRMLKRYCETAQEKETWSADEHFTYRADTRVHFICASLKDDILDLQKEDQSETSLKKSEIKGMIEEQWAAMPAVFKLDGPLSSCRQGPVELDFLVSAKLNFTHVRFLLELHAALPISNPSIELLQASAEMLSLVVEAIVMRQKLANSGTSLVWKVAYYGLAAAGVLCIALLYNTLDQSKSHVTPAKTIRDLSVLVVEIEAGLFTHPEDPNFALLSGAARTINNLLDRLITDKFTAPIESRCGTDTALPLSNSYFDTSCYFSLETQGVSEFDPAFWLSLSEHPLLLSPQRE